MADDIVVKLEEREALGKGLGQLRRDGWVPAVIHDHGKPSVHVMGKQTELSKAYKEAGKNHPVDVKIGDKTYLTLIKQAPRLPLKPDLQHIVFQAVKRDEKVEAEVPIVLEGNAPAERAGLMVLHQLDSVTVEALPKDLPDQLTLDAEKLAELGDKFTVADLVAPEGVTILTEPEHSVASVTETRASLAEQQAELDAEAAAAEPVEEATEGEEGQTEATEGESAAEENKE